MAASSLPLLGPLPDDVLEEFEDAFREHQQATLRLWKLAAQAHDAAGPADQEFAFTVNASVYDANTGRDRDGDQIACEKA